MHCSYEKNLVFILCFMIVRGQKQRSHQGKATWSRNANSYHPSFPHNIKIRRWIPASVPHEFICTTTCGASSVLNIPCSCVMQLLVTRRWRAYGNGRRKAVMTMGGDAIVIHNIYSTIWDFASFFHALIEGHDGTTSDIKVQPDLTNNPS